MWPKHRATRNAAVLGVHGRVGYQRGRAAGDPMLPGERGRRRLGSDSGPSQKGMALVCGHGKLATTGTAANVVAADVVHSARSRRVMAAQREARRPNEPISVVQTA